MSYFFFLWFDEPITMRYLPLTDVDRAVMLTTIGAESVDELFSDIRRQPASTWGVLVCRLTLARWRLNAN